MSPALEAASVARADSDAVRRVLVRGGRLIAVLVPATGSRWPTLCRVCRRKGTFTPAPSGLCAVHRWRRDAEGVDTKRLYLKEYRQRKIAARRRADVPAVLHPDFKLNPCLSCGDPIQPFKVARKSTAKGREGQRVWSWCTPAIYARRKVCSEDCRREHIVRARREGYEKNGQPDFGWYARHSGFQKRKFGEPDRDDYLASKANPTGDEDLPAGAD